MAAARNSVYCGSRCGKWHQEDGLSWCWVGMDLSCFNRERPVTPDPERSDFTKGFLAC